MKNRVKLSSLAILLSLSGCANVPERSFTQEYDTHSEIVTANLRAVMKKCWSKIPGPLEDGFRIEESFSEGKHVFEAYGYASDGRAQTNVKLVIEPVDGRSRVLFMQPQLFDAFTEKRDEDDELRWQDMKRWAKGDLTCRYPMR